MQSVLLTLSKIIPWKASELAFKNEESLQLERRWHGRCCPWLCLSCIFSPESICESQPWSRQAFWTWNWYPLALREVNGPVFPWAKGAAACMAGYLLSTLQRDWFLHLLGRKSRLWVSIFGIRQCWYCPEEITTEIHRFPGRMWVN